MARLFCKYKDVLRSGDHDVGLTLAVPSRSSLGAGLVPIRQPTRKLGLYFHRSRRVER